MSWERTHRRYRLVYAVADAVSARGTHALRHWTSRIEDEYGDVETFLLDVRRRWAMALDVQLESGDVATMAQAQERAVRANRALHRLLTVLETHAAPEPRALPQPA